MNGPLHGGHTTEATGAAAGAELTVPIVLGTAVLALLLLYVAKRHLGEN